jgi:hypothetical protein
VTHASRIQYGKQRFNGGMLAPAFSHIHSEKNVRRGNGLLRHPA